MHASAFGFGLVGTFAVWLIVVFPQLNLFEDHMNLMLCAWTVIVMPPTFFFYWKLLTSDPGYAPLPNTGNLCDITLLYDKLLNYQNKIRIV